MLDIISLITTAGYIGFFSIIFAESGFFGFFFPGDSLLFTAGFLASQQTLNIGLLMGLAFGAAVLGDSVGYAIGYMAGPKIFRREDSFFFHKDHLVKTKVFYEKHGPKTIVLARFIPIIRTFAPLLAGVGKMRYHTFLAYNIIGGALWAIGLTWLGWWLGGTIPNMDRYIVFIVIGIIVLTSLPPLNEYRKYRIQRRK
ncbi:VTT domain-containing protein [Candidatus Azambacteria bacterium]|nr:VTT domain-containing protein [Candidatus Azambacteria bacterium]MBI3685200.1 VTT domain-containing protein [Candidatus Azambacteria bacterium]